MKELVDKNRSVVFDGERLRRSRLATRGIFLACGIALSSWAPLVPMAKDRLSLDEMSLGLLLLFLGAGAMVTMPLTDALVKRAGTRYVIAASSAVIAIALPMLVVMSDWWSMAVFLTVFGVGIGMIDIAMNAHGATVQQAGGKHIMSSLHGLYSVGGLIGPVAIGLLIKWGTIPLLSTITISIVLLLICGWSYRHLMSFEEEKSLVQEPKHHDVAVSSKISAWTNKAVLFLGVMCFVAFAAEGSLLDWGAILLRDYKDVDEDFSGWGYAAFSIAMALMRMVGDRIIIRFEGGRVVLYGSMVAFLGFVMAIFSSTVFSIIGFVLIGIGAANIVPIFFTAAGRIPGLASSSSIAVVVAIGYAGMLFGPALLGFISASSSLPIALMGAGAVLLIVGLLYYTWSLRGKGK